MFTKALCPILQKSLVSVLGNKAGHINRTPTGFLDSLLSPENRRGFQQIEVGTPNGGRRYVEITYPHPASTSAVPFNPTEAGSDPLVPGNTAYTGVNAPRNSRSANMCSDPALAVRPQVQIIDPFNMSAVFSRTLALSEDDMGRICNYSTDEYRAEILMSQINGITRALNQGLLSWLFGGIPLGNSIADGVVNSGINNPGYSFGIPNPPPSLPNIVPNGSGMIGNVVDVINYANQISATPSYALGNQIPVQTDLINQTQNFAPVPQNWVRQVKSQFRRMGHNGRIITVGDGSFAANGGIALFTDLVQWGCCNIDGIDLSKASNETYFFFDTDFDAAAAAFVTTSNPGESYFLGFIPGTYQLITYNEYTGARRRYLPGKYENDTIVDPFTGLTFDFKLVYDECRELYLMTIGLQYMLWHAPRDMYGTNLSPTNPSVPSALWGNPFDPSFDVDPTNPMLGVNHALLFAEQ